MEEKEYSKEELSGLLTTGELFNLTGITRSFLEHWEGKGIQLSLRHRVKGFGGGKGNIRRYFNRDHIRKVLQIRHGKIASEVYTVKCPKCKIPLKFSLIDLVLLGMGNK